MLEKVGQRVLIRTEHPDAKRPCHNTAKQLTSPDACLRLQHGPKTSNGRQPPSEAFMLKARPETVRPTASPHRLFRV